jgi:hypothetical protein
MDDSRRWLRKTNAQLLQCFRAMTDAVLHVLTEFGERLMESSGNEKRIITESLCATRGELDSPLTRAIEKFCLQLALISRAYW